MAPGTSNLRTTMLSNQAPERLVVRIRGSGRVGRTVGRFGIGTFAPGATGSLGEDGVMTQTRIRSDAELKASVINEVDWTPSVNGTHIGVAVNEGVVTLSGEVDSYPERRLAEKAAFRIHGVTAVADEE